MAPGPMDFNTSNQPTQGEDRKRFDREIKEMTSALIHGLTDLHHMNKSNSHPMDHLDEEDHGLGVITLAGNNIGATMRSEFDNVEGKTDNGMSFNHKLAMTTYANSNFQAVNNSVMLSASYNCHDPGIHIEYVEPLIAHEFDQKEDGGKKKGNKKKGGKGTSRLGDEHSDASYYELKTK